jgi:hypothetical protein
VPNPVHQETSVDGGSRGGDCLCCLGVAFYCGSDLVGIGKAELRGQRLCALAGVMERCNMLLQLIIGTSQAVELRCVQGF